MNIAHGLEVTRSATFAVVTTPHHADPTLGRLVAADETLHHQVTDTFGAVASSDLNWTEKLWASVVAHDGSLAVAFGLGKYLNRGVVDGYAGVARGVEQWTVRGSRALALDPERSSVGPIHYDVVESLSAIRIVLERNEVQPIAFDITMRGAAPPALEGREVLRDAASNRITNDVVRYHQCGGASGWIELDGVRHNVTPDLWSFGRDHSWGIRNTVGAPPADLAPTPYPRNPMSFTSWSPVRCTRSDGSEYTLFHYFGRSNMPGHPTDKLSGGVEHADGSTNPFVSAKWVDATFTDDTRRFLGGTFIATMNDGTTRPLAFTPLSHGTGFHLGTGLYFGLNGARHGQWRGELHIDGDHYDRCDTVDVARAIHQLRDCVVRVDDPVGDGTGYGVLQTVVIGAFPELGTTLAATFI